MTSRSERWDVPPDPRQIEAVRRRVASFAAHLGMAGPALADVRVAVSDALTSAILHAGAEREAASVSVQAEQVGDELVVRVCDTGSCIAGQPICPVLGPRLSMIAALAQVLGVRRCADGATELRMHFALGRRQRRAAAAGQRHEDPLVNTGRALQNARDRPSDAPPPARPWT